MKRIFIGLAMAMAAGNASALDLDQLSALNQTTFRGLAEDLGSSMSYKPLIATESGGVTGFDVGVELTSTTLLNSAAISQAAGQDISSLVIPKLHAHKGLPLGIDVGAMYSPIGLLGAELRYAVIDGGMAMPAVGVRAAMTTLSLPDAVDFSSTSVDISVSKGLTLLTPYAGAGMVWSTTTPDASLPFTAESVQQSKYFAGVNLGLGLLNIAVEYDSTGGAQTLGAKLSAGW